MAQVKYIRLDTNGDLREANTLTDNITLNSVTLAGTTPTINMAGGTLTNLADGVAAQDAVTKQQLDNAVQGLNPKQSVLVASTANLTLSGVQTIDGVSAIAGSRVLVKNQTTPADNGIYITAAGAWTRASDMNIWAEVPTAFMFVEQGTLNADKAFVCTSDSGGTLGTTAITFVQFSAAGSYSAGNGIIISGQAIAVQLATNPGLQFTSGQLDLLLADTSLTKTASGLSANLNATGSLQTSAGLGLKLDTNPGVQSLSTGLSVLLPAVSGLQKTASGLSVLLPSNPGLQTAAGGLSALVDTNRGLAIDALGVYAKVLSGGGLQFDGSGNLRVDTAVIPVTASLLAASAVTAGQVLFVNSSGTVAPLTSLSSTDFPLGIALNSAATGVAVKYVSNNTIVGSFASLTPGSRLFWNGSTVTTTQTTTAGEKSIIVGTAVSATQIYVDIRTQSIVRG